MDKYTTFYVETPVENANNLIQSYESQGYVVKDILSAYMKPGVRHLGIIFIREVK